MTIHVFKNILHVVILHLLVIFFLNTDLTLTELVEKDSCCKKN